MSEVLLQRALRPTRRRLRELAETVSEEVRPYLEKIGERFYVPGCMVFQVQREAGATDWHVTLFKREIGLSPGRLMGLCRVDVALWLLRHTRLSVREIARLVGYRDKSGLRKLVRASCRFTPADARRRLCRVRPEYQAFGDEVVSWYFCVRFHRGEVDREELRRVLAYFKGRFGSS